MEIAVMEIVTIMGKKKMKDKEKIKLVTHNGSFHADDIFACATLFLALEKSEREIEVTRTRDKEKISGGDYVFDVGGVYDSLKNRFDHHQRGGAGQKNGIDYSSFGLVWQKFGVEVSGSEKVSEVVYKILVAPIDAFDNGIDLVKHTRVVAPYLIEQAFFSMLPSWQEIESNIDETFLKCVSMAKEILIREIRHAEAYVLAEKAVSLAYQNADDKRIIVLDKDYPSEFTKSNYPLAYFVVYPRKDSSWGAKAIHEEAKSFKNRKDFPASWGGFTGDKLASISGVPDAIFCHRALFMVVAKSKESAIKLAKLALEN